MRIILVQENGRHDSNRNFRECHNFKRCFDELGIESLVWGLGHENFKTDINNLIEDTDIIFILENYEVDGWIPDLSNKKNLKIFWSIDSHVNINGNLNVVNKHNVDIVLCAIESDMIWFDKRETIYFPNAYPHDLIFPIKNIEKKFFVGFCGTPFNSRQEWINYIENELNLPIKKDFHTLGDDMVKSINTYKIHFNYSDNDDINYRVFETLGCKTCLITNKVENLDKLFVDMEDIIMYSSIEEFTDKINFLSKNENIIEKIANNGYNKVLKEHTFLERAKKLLEIINIKNNK